MIEKHDDLIVETCCTKMIDKYGDLIVETCCTKMIDKYGDLIVETCCTKMIGKYDDLIVETCSRLLVPFIQTFGLYVLFLGHYSPGGGFQGGLLVAASLILLVIAFDIKEAKKRLPETWMIVCIGLGAGIFAGIGMLCVFLGENFLDYSSLVKILPVSTEKARAYGILGIEIGVQISVVACLFSIFLDLLSKGEHEEGLL